MLIAHLFYHTRNLNTWESTKETAIDTYDGLKNIVQRNVIMSICIAVGVILLFILCWYLRRKHARNAHTMSRREHDTLLEQRAERKATKERHRKNRRKIISQQEPNVEQDEAGLQDTSFETKATILSDTQEDYRDIEKDGIELKMDEHLMNTFKPSTEHDEDKQRQGFRRN